MTGSMYAAVSGLRTHMSALNVIGNNISNVNTFGYKASRYTFNEALYTTSRSGSNGTDEIGGRNPAQIGYGCSVGTIDLNMTTQSYNPTGQALDCMIDGDGFFLVGDKTKTGVNSQAEINGMELTRHGNFEFRGGYLTDGNGRIVYGFLNTAEAEVNPVISTVLTPIRLPWYNDRTKQIFMPSQVEDDDGNPDVADNEEAVAAYEASQQAGALTTQGDYKRVKLDTITIDESSGFIMGVTEDDIQITIGCMVIAKVDSPNGVTHTDGRYYMALGGAGDVHLTTLGGSVTYPPIDPTTGEPMEDDSEGMMPVVASAGDSRLITGGLESSGTDLADEISHMIVIQRGYQANTRIVTVTDSMLEELINMKR